MDLIVVDKVSQAVDAESERWPRKQLTSGITIAELS